MTLYEFLEVSDKNDEIEVYDDTYDCVFYFSSHTNSDDLDEWEKSMVSLSKLLTVKKGKQVNLTELVESHLDSLKKYDLFIYYTIDDIMGDMESILAGYVSEDWLGKFVKALSE